MGRRHSGVSSAFRSRRSTCSGGDGRPRRGRAGCGTAYVSAGLAEAPLRVGVDPTPAQLDTAREMQREFGLEFPLVEAIGEDVRAAGDASFDLAVSEFGASTWADPTAGFGGGTAPAAGWPPRFPRNSTLSMLCMDLEGATESLQRQRDMNRIEWPDTGEVEFHLPHGD